MCLRQALTVMPFITPDCLGHMHCIGFTVTFINTVNELKEYLCRAYTQNIFTFNRTTTQGSESFNDTMKGHKDLKQYLSNADLFALHSRLENIKRRKDMMVKNKLVKLRQSGKRWSNVYHQGVRKSMQLAATKVRTVEKIGDDLYDVTDIDGKLTHVNLATKVLHRGYVYSIPTCDCGYYRSGWRMCKCMIRPLSIEGREVLQVTHVHPLHHLQLHPMWKWACIECKREDYKDFPHRNVGMDNAQVATVNEVSAEVLQVYTCPDRFFDRFGAMPKKENQRYIKLSEACEELKKLAVNDGNEQTFRYAHARVTQTTNEIKGDIAGMSGHLNAAEESRHPIVQCPPQSLKSNSQRARTDAVNNSRLGRGRGRASRRGGGRGGSRSNAHNNVSSRGDSTQTKFCHQCYILQQGTTHNVDYRNHTTNECGMDEQYAAWVELDATTTNDAESQPDCKQVAKL